jgi:hypothetical protein
MKTIIKIAFPLILAGSLIISSSFRGNPEKNAQVVVPMGTFATYLDYQKKNLVIYDEIKLGHGGYKGVLKGKKVSGAYKSADFWGAESEDGVFYRVNKKANIAPQIISNAKICFYAGMELSVSRFYDGSVKSVDLVNVDKGTKFSELFWISAGGEGDMIAASMDNLATLMADSPDLVTKMKAKGIEEKNADKWFDNITNISGWIKDYETLHTAAATTPAK